LTEQNKIEVYMSTIVAMKASFKFILDLNFIFILNGCRLSIRHFCIRCKLIFTRRF